MQNKRKAGLCEKCGMESDRLITGSKGKGIGGGWICPECVRYNNIYYLYGLTKEQYLELLETQNSKCAICGIPETVGPVDMDNRKGRLCIDHCHSTKAVRGLLCNSCNTVVGMSKENTDFLRKTIEYIENTKAVETNK